MGTGQKRIHFGECAVKWVHCPLYLECLERAIDWGIDSKTSVSWSCIDCQVRKDHALPDEEVYFLYNDATVEVFK